MGGSVTLYLDTNVLCRPFDDQWQRRIREETEAFEKILAKLITRTAELVTSEILFYEVTRVVGEGKQRRVAGGFHWGAQPERVCGANEMGTVKRKEDRALIQEGWRILVNKLGLQKATRFVVSFEHGEGDAVREIQKFWSGKSLDEIYAEVKRAGARSRSRRCAGTVKQRVS